jgi:hypothetical protein
MVPNLKIFDTCNTYIGVAHSQFPIPNSQFPKKLWCDSSRCGMWGHGVSRRPVTPNVEKAF